MKHFRYLFAFLFISVTMISCDEKEIIIPEITPVASDRIVLIEDFSGVACVNCPNAGRAIDAIMVDHPDNVIAITVYTNELGLPYPQSKCDLRTESGVSIQNDLGVLAAKPAGTFNRVVLAGNDRFNLKPNLWENLVVDQLNNPVLANLNITHTYNESTRMITAKVTANAVADINEPVRISLCITENGIIDAQLDGGGLDLEYEHKHVLRDYITPFDGESFVNSMQANDLVQKTFEYQIPTDLGSITNNSCPIDAANCNLVAFIHYGSSTNKEVIQAAEVHVVE